MEIVTISLISALLPIILVVLTTNILFSVYNTLKNHKMLTVNKGSKKYNIMMFTGLNIETLELYLYENSNEFGTFKLTNCKNDKLNFGDFLISTTNGFIHVVSENEVNKIIAK